LSICFTGSIGSIGSIGSAESILSIGSMSIRASILSARSHETFMSWRAHSGLMDAGLPNPVDSP